MLNLSFTCSPFQYQLLWLNIMTVFFMILFQTAGFIGHFLKSIMNRAYETPFTTEEFLYSKFLNLMNYTVVVYGTVRQTPINTESYDQLSVWKDKFLPLYHVSHSCHNKKCINIQATFITQERGKINVHRNSCRQSNTCCGHDGFKNCIFR